MRRYGTDLFRQMRTLRMTCENMIIFRERQPIFLTLRKHATHTLHRGRTKMQTVVTATAIFAPHVIIYDAADYYNNAIAHLHHASRMTP